MIKTVRFNPETSILLSINRNDFLQEESDAYWFNSVEYKEIKKEIELTMFMYQAGKAIESDTFTMRGLMNRTEDGELKRFKNRQKALIAVLDKQCEQYNNQHQHEKQIAQIYIKNSKKCAREALTLAKQDEEDARIIYQDQDDSLQRESRVKKKNEKNPLSSTRSSLNSSSLGKVLTQKLVFSNNSRRTGNPVDGGKQGDHGMRNSRRTKHFSAAA